MKLTFSVILKSKTKTTAMKYFTARYSILFIGLAILSKNSYNFLQQITDYYSFSATLSM